jgi:hypothetical protein
MYKIKKKKKNTLVQYQDFLKNNDLKKKKFKLKNILFENEILLKKKGMNIIELKKKNIFIPISLPLKRIIYTIQTQYQEHFLLNYHFNFNLLYYFSKIMFKNNVKENLKTIKARIIGGNRKGILIAIFGLIFTIKPKQLHKNRRIFYKSKLKSTKIISFYKLKYLNFKIEKNNPLYKKSILSRKLYVKEINEKKKK